MKKVSIVIPVYNNLKMTIDCINDVLKTYGTEYELIVVDDGSTREPVYSALSRMFPQITLLKNEENLGFAKTVNKGIRAAKNDLILLLNNDIRISDPQWLHIMIDNMERNNLDLTAPAGGRMTDKWEYIPGEAKNPGDKFSYLVGWCLLTKRSVFDKIGLIPEDFGRGFFEDVLWGYRAKKAGFKAGITKMECVHHLYHATFKSEGFNLSEEYNKKRKIFLDIIKREK